ncbi:MAG: Gfo/Idh/MocA family protein [Pseudomonadota bacterium]
MDTGMVRVGVVGTGKWANNVHLAAYQDHPLAQVVGVCDISLKRAQQAAARFGAEFATIDYGELIARDDVDAIDVITPNVNHAEVVLAAIGAGKHVMCEKPMAMNVAEAREMFEAATAANIKAGVNFTWRNAGAARYAKHIVQTGQLGRIYHVYGSYISDFGRYKEIPLIWRLQKRFAGTGALGDTGSHIIDLVEWITGERITRLIADLNTFVKERPLTDGSGVGEVDVDDAVSILARLEGGGMGTLHSTFYGTAQGMEQKVEIFGEKGALALRWQNQQTISLSVGHFADENQMLEVPIPERFKAPDHQLKRQNIYSFVEAISQDKKMSPDFQDGLRNQTVIDAVVASARSGNWVTVL